MTDGINLQRVLDRRRGEVAARQKKYARSSKDQLSRVIRKKTNTIFIGAIAQFEKFFGRLWGHGKDDEDCTPAELEFRKVWMECRTEVLNGGNAQLRALLNEISQYEIVWNRHHLDLVVQGENSADNCQQKDVQDSAR